ncbi:MAG: hypothetical protein IRZ07_07380, partial [Microbispora sp.]|nr:hypothetical protein [Microbispora sp.]
MDLFEIDPWRSRRSDGGTGAESVAARGDARFGGGDGEWWDRLLAGSPLWSSDGPPARDDCRFDLFPTSSPATDNPIPGMGPGRKGPIVNESAFGAALFAGSTRAGGVTDTAVTDTGVAAEGVGGMSPGQSRGFGTPGTPGAASGIGRDGDAFASGGAGARAGTHPGQFRGFGGPGAREAASGAAQGSDTFTGGG